MEHRDDWIRELERRQDNIDPIRRIPNGALFHGSLINGNLRLNRVQRAGALFLGFVDWQRGVLLLPVPSLIFARDAGPTSGS